jgi:hypothetical protein
MTCPHGPRLGAIALGANDNEQHDLDRHLRSCPECRTELDGLREVSGLLRSVHIEDVTAPASAEPTGTPDDLLGRVLATMTAERETGARKRRRTRRLVAAAAAVVVGLAGAGIAIGRPDFPAVLPVELPVASSTLGVRATTSVLDQPWGTRIEMGLRGLPDGSSCRLVAVAQDGSTETVAAWHVSYGNAFHVEAMTSIQARDLAGLQVVDQTGRRLIDVAVRPKEGPSK